MVLPASWGLIKILLLATFFIHLLFMNILLGSVVLAAVNAFKPSPTPRRAFGFAALGAPAGNYAAMSGNLSLAPGLMALTVNFGVAPLLFAQVAYGSYLYASSVLMAIWWMSVPLLAMLAYYGLYVAKEGQPAGLGGRRLLLGLILAVLLCVAFIHVNNHSLMLRPDRWVAWFAAPGGALLNLGDPTLLPRYSHFIISALAVGGLFLALRADRLLRLGKIAGNRMRLKRGLSWFFWASLVQFPIGLWFLFALPDPARDLFLGQDLLASFAMLLAIIGSVAALFAARAGRVRICAGFTLGVVFVMVCIRDLARDALLGPLPPALALPIDQGQTAALVIFLLVTGLGLVALAWMIRIAWQLFCVPPAGSTGTNDAASNTGRS
jgi:hypothetical protein